MSKRKPFIIILTIIAVITAWYAINASFNQKIILPKNKNLASSSAKDVKVIRFDKQGQLNSILVTPKLIHFNVGNITEFIHPKITLYSKDHSKNKQMPWVISADKGKAINKFNNIELTGHVKLHQAAGKNNQEVTILTTSLNLNTKTQIATTNAPVTMKQISQNHSVNIIKSVGVRVNQKTGVIRLLSHARGFYVPAS